MKSFYIRLTNKKEEEALNDALKDIKDSLKVTGIKKMISNNQAIKFLILNNKKRGQLFSDLFLWMMLILVIAIVGFLVVKVFLGMAPVLKSQSSSGSVEFDIINKQITRFPQVVQSIILVIFFGIGIATLVSAFMVRNYPFFAVIMLMLMIFVAVSSPVIANFYDNFANNTTNGETSDTLSGVKFLFDWFPRIMIVLSLMAVVLMFAKRQE